MYKNMQIILENVSYFPADTCCRHLENIGLGFKVRSQCLIRVCTFMIHNIHDRLLISTSIHKQSIIKVLRFDSFSWQLSLNYALGCATWEFSKSDLALVLLLLASENIQEQINWQSLLIWKNQDAVCFKPEFCPEKLKNSKK